MADRRLGTTAALIGGKQTPHGKRCPCSKCGDWDRIFKDDLNPPKEEGEEGSE